MSRYELIRPVKPTLFDRLKRSIYLGPFNPKDKKIAEMFGGRPASSGIAVNESTALNYSAVFSAIQLIAGDVATLPLVLYRRSGDGKEVYREHSLFRLLHDQANPDMSAFTFRETVQGHVLSWGNGYAEIERDGANRPKYLWPLTPDRVTLERDGPGWRYRVTNPGSRDVFLNPPDMLHIPGLGFDGMTGYAVIAKMREAIGLGIAAEQFGGAFFGNGTTFGGVFSTEKVMNADQVKNWRETMEADHQGVRRAHRDVLVQNGMKYTARGIPPDDAQFLETRQFQVTEIARWFGVPPHKIGDLSRATFSNIEQQNIEYYQTTLVRWLERWEQILMLKLISPLERNQQLIEFVTDGILRGDSAGRAALETAQFNTGSVMINELRALENRNPVPGGNRTFVPLNMIPLDKLDEWLDAEIESKKAPDPPPAPEPPPSQAARDHILFLQDRVSFFEKDEGKLRAQIAAVEGERDAYAQKVRAAEQRAEDLAAANTQLEQQCDAAISERDSAREAVNVEQLARAKDKADHDVAIANAEALRVDLATKLTACEAIADDYQARFIEADREAERLKSEVQELRTERDGARAATDAAGVALTAAQAERDQAVTSQREAEAARAADVQRAEQADRDKATAEQALAEATELIARRRQTDVTRMTAVISAHRALMVDAMRRLITKETDRARRHQATPQKLRAWLDTFYEGHVDAITETLEPVVRAHLAWMQSDKDAVLIAREIATAHAEDSQQQLRSLLATEDAAQGLDRLLIRWEEKRPDAIADRFVKEGVEYVRSL